MSGHKHVTEKEYEGIKSYLNIFNRRGDIGKIAKLTGRSSNTIHYISESKDFEDYRENLRALRQREQFQFSNESPVAEAPVIQETTSILEEILERVKHIENEIQVIR